MATVDEVRLLVRAEIKDALGKLDTLKRRGGETADGITDKFAKGFKAIVASAAILKAKSLFEGAVNQAVRFEKALQGVSATARVSGESVDETRKAVLKLAADGQIGVDKLSDAMKFLISQGKSVDEAFTVIDAAKKVGVLENAVGDAGQAVVDFAKFTVTGAAALAENLSPALVKTIKNLGGYSKVATDAKANQKFLNAVVDRGTLLTEDYNKATESLAGSSAKLAAESDQLAAAIGEGLASAGLITALADFLKFLRLILIDLTPATKGIFALSAAFVALGTALKGIGAVSTGTLGLISAAAGLFSAASAAVDLLLDSEKRRRREATSTLNVLRKQERQLKSLTKAEREGVKGKAALAQANATLESSAKALGIAFKGEARSIEEVIEATKRLNEASITVLKQRRRAAVRTAIGLGREIRLLRRRVREGDLTSAQAAGRISVRQKIRRDLIREARKITAEIEKIRRGGRKKSDAAFSKGNKKRAKEAATAERFETLATLDLALAQIKEKENAELARIQTELEAELKRLDAIEKKKIEAAKDEVNNFFELQREKERIEAEFRKRRADAENNANKKRTEAEILGIRASRKLVEGRIAGFASNAAGDLGGRALGKIPGFRGTFDRKNPDGSVTKINKGAAAFGGIQGAVGAFGTIKGLVTGIGEFFDGIFGSEKDLLEVTKERTEQIELTGELIEKEIELQKTLISLTKERDALLSKEANRQVRLNSILIDDDKQRNQANLQVFQQLLAEQQKSFGLEGLSVQQTADVIGSTESSIVSNKSVLAVINQVLDNFIFAGKNGVGIANSAPLLNALNQALATPGVSPEVKGLGSQVLNSLGSFGTTLGAVLQQNFAGGFEQQIASATNFTKEVENQFKGIRGAVDVFVSEQDRLLTNADAIFDVFGNIKDIQRSLTSDAQSLELAGGRESSFIDVSRLGRFSLGEFVGSATPSALGFSQTVSGAIATTERAKSNQTILAENSEVMKNELIKIRVLIAGLVGILDSSSSTGGDFTEQLVLQTQNAINNNSLNIGAGV